ncbi:spore germination protein GerPB [Paenibacillus tarimensis]|uniref:spore germination protein GerPB n=1 Tax=Paenibacillus tarimensis TaxID=416012 RepID=UPI001F436545|nr:spore germination protein GerPB [Paenibacillus tarimensis]MCF2942399.1 spore germination protein GerPB [Paenibacillus tarimensis]
MNLTVHQHITIQQLRVNNITNSSVLQVGSAGSIRALSHAYEAPDSASGGLLAKSATLGLVPLPNPS